MKGEVLDHWCERGILSLVLAVLVIGPLAMGATGPIAFLTLQGLTLAIMALWLVRLWAIPKFKLLWPPITWAVIAFALYAVVRYRYADLEYLARLETVQVVLYAFLFLAIVNNLHGQEEMQLIVFTLLFVAMAISFWAVYQLLAGSDAVWWYVKPYAHRGSGTYISPNHMAGFLEMLLPLGLALLLASRIKPLAKVLVGYASFSILAGIAVSLSKGAWGATAAALLVFFGVLALHRTHRLPALALLVVLVVGGYFVIPRTQLVRDRVHQYMSPSGQVNDDMRFAIWGAAVKVWKTDPWWGVGPNLFNTRFPEYRPIDVQRQPERVHNDYLNTLVDWGVVGSVPVAIALALLAWGVIRTWPFVRGSSSDLVSKRSNKFSLVLGASVGLLAMLLHSVVDFNLHIPANAIVAVTLIAILSACLRFATERYWVTARVWMKALLSAALLAGIVCLSWQGARRAHETIWLRRAQAAKPLSAERLFALQQAFRVEPHNAQTAFDIGELYCLRAQNPVNDQDPNDMATNAMTWLNRSMALNPYDAKSCVDYGICLDLLDRPTEAAVYFDRACVRDPNNYFVDAYVGWHYVQKADFAAARMWFKRSVNLEWDQNTIASTYLPIIRERMLEAASGNPFGLDLPKK
jgi:O-antigen ligase